MKRFITIIVAIFSFAFITSARPEKERVSPTYGITITKYLTRMDINGKNYYNVECVMKASSGAWRYAVKVVVKSDGAVIYKHTFKGAYLYLFSDGQIQVGVPRLDWLIIWAKGYDGIVTGIINDREGVSQG